MMWRNERGDTLIEVTLALSILALVLTGAFATANKAFSIGQDAKERSQLVGDAQQQAEALQSFRDSYRWNEFVAGRASAGVPGISVRSGSGDCDTSQAGVQSCFHMERRTVNGAVQWVPVVGEYHDPMIGGGLSYVRILTQPGNPPANPNSYTFTIQYGVPARGGGQPLASSLKLYLTNLDQLRR
jgi:prepilin-type N-terminal cleavage/methylation domain-containing protein